MASFKCSTANDEFYFWREEYANVEQLQGEIDKSRSGRLIGQVSDGDAPSVTQSVNFNLVVRIELNP